MTTRNPILCAIDTPDSGAARALVAAVAPVVGGLKLGLEFFIANGPEAVRRVAGAAPLFLDLKLHDIPNTVAGAVRSVAPLAPLLLTVHCAGGAAMMKAAAEAAAGRMKIIGVTVLTSLDDADLAATGQNGPAQDQARRLAALAQEAGLDGIVCSPREAGIIRESCGREFLIVTPGIRPEGGETDDQSRTLTPRAALDAGADFLVVGRPIVKSEDPLEAAETILLQMDGA